GRQRRMLEEKPSLEASGRELLESHHGLEALFLELQELVMKIRMVPVGPTFHRFARSVRDAARKNGKLARMLVVGEDVEVDTTILEHIHDPLMHMIRNSVDHGLEMPEVRRVSGYRNLRDAPQFGPGVARTPRGETQLRRRWRHQSARRSFALRAAPRSL